MSITTILFDLDGTLLPMNQDVFSNAYVKGLAMTAATAGYEPKAFSKAIIAGTYAMVKNDGARQMRTRSGIIDSIKVSFKNTAVRTSSHGSFISNPITRQSRIKSISSEKRSISP